MSTAQVTTSENPVCPHAMPLRLVERRTHSRFELGGALSYGVALAIMLAAFFRIEQPPAGGAAAVGAAACTLLLVGRRVTVRTLPPVLGLAMRAAAGALFGATSVGVVVVGAQLDEIASILAATAALVFGFATLHDLRQRTTRVVVVGDGPGTRCLVRDAGHMPHGFAIVATVGGTPFPRPSGVPHYDSVTDLAEAVEAHRPDLVVVGTSRGRPEIQRELLDLADAGFRVIDLPEFYAYAFGRVPVTSVTPAWFISVLHLYRRPYTTLAKRTFDIVAAGLLLALTLPPQLVIALLVGRPVLFKQVRVGQWGEQFTMFKFRTMRLGSEELGVPRFTSLGDSRVTRIGRILRKTRLDELPQLLNVLAGDMSFVGPRPERPEFDEPLTRQIPWWKQRTMLKPGITGWAQINADYSDDVATATEKLAYDLWYLRHCSVLIDLMICLKTAPKLIVGFGAR